MKASINTVVEDAKRRDSLNRMNMPIITLSKDVTKELLHAAFRNPLDFDKHCNALIVDESGVVQGIITYRMQVLEKSALGTILLGEIKKVNSKSKETEIKEENTDDR